MELLSLRQNRETGFFTAHVKDGEFDILIEETAAGHSIVSFATELTPIQASPFVVGMDSVRKAFEEEKNNLTKDTKSVESHPQIDENPS